MSAHRSRFSGFGSSRRSAKAAGAVIACGAILLAGCGGSAADADAPLIRGDAEANAAVAQTALTVNTPSTGTAGTAGTAIVLGTSGGSGDGAVNYTVTGTDCSVTDTRNLNATPVAICIVTAKKAASTGYLEAMSAPKTFTFSAATVAQAALTVDTPSTGTAGSAGTAIVLSTSGGSGDGAVTLTVTGTDCSVTETKKLNATRAATCIVTAKKAVSTRYLEATSAPKTFTFGAAAVAQAALTVSNTPLYGNVGTNIELFWSGGSGTGAVAFTVTGTGCSVIKVNNGKLKMTQAGDCVVTATRAASTGYLVATSAATTFTWYLPVAQAKLTVSNTTLTGTVNNEITLGTLGGSGDGAVTYTVTGANCSVSGTLLKATRRNNCVVTARKAASQGGWLEATSATKTFAIT